MDDYKKKYIKYKNKYINLKNRQRGGNQNKEKSLYLRLGGIYTISAVVNHFSDAVVNNPIAGKNSPNQYLREWYTNQMEGRLPGLKWMRTLWLCDNAGGPYKYVPTVAGACPFSLENAHKNLRISPEEFDAVAGELAKSLDHFKVPEKEKNEVLAVFALHKPEVDQGYFISKGMPVAPVRCPFRNK
ncbi:MAG: globin [Edafosvirus sp.]|uniref:Globin n=1 Tax=Edafosvirus sp. TaxID=2487765 RepID=A0A3G4ZUD7_9VIRU|nr:MAG: globin [Edafosvirus sp.]